MDKIKAIPEGYMTVGELAKKMNTTVRTLQYYDSEGLLKPSCESEGGRRLYDEKAMINLYQILSLKSIGLSLDDIKKSLYSLDTHEEVIKMLSDQKIIIKKKIESLTNTLNEMEVLKEEVIKMKKVDFKKYSDIITNLRMKNDFYWLIKHIDDKTMDKFRNEYNESKGQEVINKTKSFYKKAYDYAKNNIKPDSDIAIKFGKEFWEFIYEFTKGDINLLDKLMKLDPNIEADMIDKEKQMIANEFIGKALESYFIKNNINPFNNI